MEKLFNAYERESMKLAMLKHEQTFKEQVSELHRLYRIQKSLMKKVHNNSSLDHAQYGEKIGDESNVDLTLGLSTFNPRKKTPNNALNSDSYLTLSSSSSSEFTTGFATNQGAAACDYHDYSPFQASNSFWAG